MKERIIYKGDLNDYVSQTWEQHAVWRFYAQLTGYLKDALGSAYAAIFAKPAVTESTKTVQWLSAELSREAKQLTTLSVEEQKSYESDIEAKHEVLRKEVQKLKTSQKSNDRDLGEILELFLVFPDLSHIFVENGKWVIVGWGFQKRSESSLFDLKVALNQIGKREPQQHEQQEKQQELQKEELEEQDSTEEQQDKIEEQQDTTERLLEQRQKEIEAERERLREREKQLEEEQQRRLQELERQRAEEKARQEQLEKERRAEEQKRLEELEKERQRLQRLEEERRAAERKRLLEIEQRRTSLFYWVKRIGFFLLLLLILVLVWWFWPSASSSYLPEEPGIYVPIEQEDIGENENKSKIILNRLNVWLSPTGNQNLTLADLEAFAKAFKQAYPQDEYKIIYYNLNPVRIQIEVPPEEREKVQRELPDKLNNWELKVFEEAVMQNEGMPSEPDFQDSKKAWYHERVQAYQAWDITPGDSTVIVAVIDDGFDLKHPELSGNIVRPYNIPARSKRRFTALDHGTHVAATVAGRFNNGIGLSGIAPNCKVMPIQVSDRRGYMTTVTIIDAIYYAINQGADVINMSLGAQLNPLFGQLPVEEQLKLIGQMGRGRAAMWNKVFDDAKKSGVTVVLAGGNSDMIVGLDPMQRSPHTIKVAAIGSNNERASFSNYGPYTTVSAPGVAIYNAKPNGSYGPMSGTSMAAPIVAAGVALIKSVNPRLTNEDIVQVLRTTGLPLQTDKEIAPLVQLANAVALADKNREQQPRVDCPDIQQQIDSLLRLVDDLRSSCPDTSAQDTLVIPDNPNDLQFVEGLWKSTTELFATATGEKVTLYFLFNANGTGEIQIGPKGDWPICSAPLSLTVQQNTLLIDQLSKAECQNGGYYSPYRIKCETDASGHARCQAVNKQDANNYIEFNLVRVNDYN